MNLEEAITICPAPAAIVERDSRRADEITKQIKSLDSSSASLAFDQGDLFAEVEKEAHWASLRYESLEEYYKSLNIDLSVREIQYRSKISTAMKKLGLDRAQYAPARISKLKEITRLSPEAELKDEDTGVVEYVSDIMKRLIKEAPLLTLAEVKAQVDELLRVSEDDDDALTWINLPIRRDAKKVVTQALDLAKAQAGDTVDIETKETKDLSDAAALELVCASYLADPNNDVDGYGEGGDFIDSVETGNEHDS